MAVYLLHFTSKFHHAQHYLGFTDDVQRRISEHQRERVHLMGAVNAAKIPWLVAKIWPEGDRALERKLKHYRGSAQFCPICRALAGQPSVSIMPIGAIK